MIRRRDLPIIIPAGIAILLIAYSALVGILSIGGPP